MKNLSKKISRIILIFLFFSIFLFTKTYAYKNPGTPTGFVNDYTDTLTLEQEQSLEQKISDFEKQTTNEISVVIIKNLEGDTIENFAVKLFEDWKIGKKETDNGVLIIISMEDRQIRIETGYGMEPYIVDTQAFWIIDKTMKPEFRNNNYYGGIDKAVDQIISATHGIEIPKENKNTKSSIFDNETIINFLIIIFIFLINVFATALGKTKSFLLGGVLGTILGAIIGVIIGTFILGIVITIILGILGLGFDYAVSKNYKNNGRGGFGGWFLGGFGGRGGSSGGFGGFGGGGSGGGGSSGGW